MNGQIHPFSKLEPSRSTMDITRWLSKHAKPAFLSAGGAVWEIECSIFIVIYLAASLNRFPVQFKFISTVLRIKLFLARRVLSTRPSEESQKFIDKVEICRKNYYDCMCFSCPICVKDWISYIDSFQTRTYMGDGLCESTLISTYPKYTPRAPTLSPSVIFIFDLPSL